MTEASAPEWTTEKVLETLRRQAPPGQSASAQVFLHENVAAEEVMGKAQQIVGQATGQATGTARSAEIGKVHRMAKSFSVTAVPDVIAEIAKSDDVKAILPSKIDDIYPKPVEKSRR